MSLNKKSTVGILIGPPGSGKSWSLVRYLVEEHLKDGTGWFISNLPLKVDVIVKEVSEFLGVDPEDVRRRVHVIPPKIFEEWRDGRSSMEDYFDRVWLDICREKNLDPDDEETQKAMHPLSRARVVIDEARKILPKKPSKSQERFVAATFDWLATVRHEGCRIIFCAQARRQLHSELFSLCGFEIELSNLGDLPLPYVGIRADTVFQAVAKLGLPYYQWVQEEEFITLSGKPELTKSRRWILTPRYFRFYDSYNKDKGGSGEQEPPEYQRFGWGRFLVWAYTENWYPITKSAACVAAFAALVWPWGLAFSGWMWLQANAAEIMTPSSLIKAAAPAQGETAASANVAATSPDELISQNRDLAEAVKVAAVEIADLRAVNERLQAEVEAASQLALVDASGVILANGDRIDVGERISYGPFRGQILESVNYRARSARLGDGRELRLREPRRVYEAEPAEMVAERQRPQPTPAAPAELRGSLPPTSGEDTGWYSVRGARPPRPTPAVIQQPLDQR